MQWYEQGKEFRTWEGDELPVGKRAVISVTTGVSEFPVKASVWENADTKSKYCNVFRSKISAEAWVKGIYRILDNRAARPTTTT